MKYAHYRTIFYHIHTFEILPVFVVCAEADSDESDKDGEDTGTLHQRHQVFRGLTSKLQVLNGAPGFGLKVRLSGAESFGVCPRNTPVASAYFAYVLSLLSPAETKH
jgi:hypothetical protein